MCVRSDPHADNYIVIFCLEVLLRTTLQVRKILEPTGEHTLLQLPDYLNEQLHFT